MQNDQTQTTRYMLWNTSAGSVHVEFPARVSAEDVTDLEELTAPWLRGLRHRPLGRT